MLSGNKKDDVKMVANFPTQTSWRRIIFIIFSGVIIKKNVHTLLFVRYLGLSKKSCQEGPKGEDTQANSQHGAMEEAHHLVAAKVNCHL